MPCYLTSTGSFLPGPVVENDHIDRYLGALPGEEEVRRTVLRMNGIRGRHYAQDERQRPTHNVYQLAACAARAALDRFDRPPRVTFLSAGSTHAPLSGPGIASILHDQLGGGGPLSRPVEISSHSGICSSSAAAMAAAARAVEHGEHAAALCVGAEHASEVLKSTAITPIDDRDQHPDVRTSQWFMSVFLRFMLSDGAGAFLLTREPAAQRVSLRVDWTHSRSYAHQAPLCMKLVNASGLLSQDVALLSRKLFPLACRFLEDALTTHDESLGAYHVVLPHMSSFFFRKKMERVLRENSPPGAPPVPYWTNLATRGNTGAASIYVMLDQYLREHPPEPGQRLLLFVPESGQFNFVMVSLTAVAA